MLRQFLIAKIHRAVVTARDVHYVGSITIDPEVMKAVGILTWERVQVVDVNNGARFETYAIPGTAGQGQIQLNGAAAHLVELGDRVIIMAYGWLNEDEIASLCPRVALMDEHNHVSEVRVLEPSPE
jgi:aspartate 1-decarboxylase